MPGAGGHDGNALSGDDRRAGAERRGDRFVGCSQGAVLQDKYSAASDAGGEHHDTVARSDDRLPRVRCEVNAPVPGPPPHGRRRKAANDAGRSHRPSSGFGNEARRQRRGHGCGQPHRRDRDDGDERSQQEGDTRHTVIVGEAAQPMGDDR